MKRLFGVGLFLLLVLSSAIPVAAAPLVQGNTYTVMVGAENVSQGVGIMSFFPGTLTIHVGDTVVWKANSHEIHTVTFLPNGMKAPNLEIPAPMGLGSPLMLNPVAAFPNPASGDLYDGSTYANSGILSTDPGFATQYRLTFTKTGSFPYLCLVHGVMMSGAIHVVPASVAVKNPAAIAKQSALAVTTALAKGLSLIGAGMKLVPAPVLNPDGTSHFTVLIGYASGAVEAMRFFPSKLVVHPGDTVTYKLSPANDAPHTVTFLNGNADIPFVIVTPNPPNPPYLLINPLALAPINPGVPLNNTQVFSSGFLVPGGSSSYALKIGSTLGVYSYQCLLHDTSGMVGQLSVVPR